MGLLIVDVQEHYDGQYGEILVDSIIAEAQKHDEVSMFWVGGDISNETEKDVLSYWGSFEPPESFFSNLTLHEKVFGYLNEWCRLPQEFLVRAIGYMARHGMTTSADIPQDEMYRMRVLGCPAGWRLDVPEGNIVIPDWDYDFFRRKSWKTCGGHETECLWEVETLLKGHGVEVDRLPDLTW